MKVNISNYEIWFLDWLDGNLSDLQVEQLKIFLSENPALKEEFDELNSFSLKPSGISFPHKEHLKKSAADLSPSQFEYLCIACLENDLSESQQTELKGSIDQDPEKKKTFELIRKTKLAPEHFSYKNKNQLIKRTTVQRVMRLSLVGLSAAATIALIIMINLITPRNQSDKTNNTAQNIVTDSILQQPPVNLATNKIITDKNPVISKQKRKNPVAGVQNNNIIKSQSYPMVLTQNDSTRGNTDIHNLQLSKIIVPSDIDIEEISVSNTLIAFNNPIIISSANEDERSRFSKFIAKTFREKILKEKTTKDSPLKGYEIAEAGVTGLNKLFGWEMALEKNNDTNGELKSVYFSSKILKFIAPVKKTESKP
jgi:hypothetical protein